MDARMIVPSHGRRYIESFMRRLVYFNRDSPYRMYTKRRLNGSTAPRSPIAPAPRLSSVCELRLKGPVRKTFRFGG